METTTTNGSRGTFYRGWVTSRSVVFCSLAGPPRAGCGSSPRTTVFTMERLLPTAAAFRVSHRLSEKFLMEGNKSASFETGTHEIVIVGPENTKGSILMFLLLYQEELFAHCFMP